MLQYTTRSTKNNMFNKMDPKKEFSSKKKAFGIQLILPPTDPLPLTNEPVLGIVAGLENWPATAATKLGVCRVEPDVAMACKEF